MKSRARNFVISIDFFRELIFLSFFFYFSGVCFYFECWPQDWFKKFGLNFWDFHVEKFVKRLWIYLAEFEYYLGFLFWNYVLNFQNKSKFFWSILSYLHSFFLKGGGDISGEHKIVFRLWKGFFSDTYSTKVKRANFKARTYMNVICT